MSKKNLKSISLILAGTIFAGYIGYQAYKAFYSPIKTETALYVTSNDTIDTTGYVIKDEEIIEKSGNGVLSYLIEDGERIEKNGEIAQLYASAEDAVIDKQIKSLEGEINRLNSINYAKNLSSGNPETINKQILNSMADLILDVNKAELINIGDDRDNILYSINARQIMTGKVKGFDDRISKLESKKSELSKKYKNSIGRVTSPQPGYFVSKIDGYENKLPYNSVFSLTPKQLRADIKPDDISSKNVVGKLIKKPTWYIACLVSNDKAIRLGLGKELTIKLPFASTEDIPCTVAAVNQADKTSDAVLILSCNYMSRELSMLRKESMKINVNTYNGIRISKRALHQETLSRRVKDEKGKETTQTQKVKGVYVLYGGELIFKQIVSLYADKNYIICNPDPDRGLLFTEDTIKLYDQVVTEGTDLYNGKVIK